MLEEIIHQGKKGKLMMWVIMERKNSRLRTGKMNKEDKLGEKDTPNRKKKTRKETFPKMTRTRSIEPSMDNLTVGNENQEKMVDLKTSLKRGKILTQENRIKVKINSYESAYEMKN